jgi:hypothetical protein
MQPARFTENLYARAQFVRLQLATDVAPVPPVAPDVAGRLPRVADAPAPLARDLVSWLRDTERGFVSAPRSARAPPRAASTLVRGMQQAQRLVDAGGLSC